MIPQYTLTSYRLTVAIRTRKTILVEGPTDAGVVSRLLKRRALQTGKSALCLVDDARLLRFDPSEMNDPGNRTKVMVAGEFLSGMSEKFAWLVDREWDGIDFDDLPSTVEPVFAHLPTGHLTRGHSIENYVFRFDIVADYYRMRWGDVLPNEFFNALEERFQSILRLAAATSIVAAKLSVVERLTGLPSADDLEWVDGHYRWKESLDVRAAHQRGITVPIAGRIFEVGQSPAISGGKVELVQWVSHGHIARETLKVCVAHLARHYCSDQKALSAIESGDRGVEVAHSAHKLCELPEEHFRPIDRLLDWAVADHTAAPPLAGIVVA